MKIASGLTGAAPGRRLMTVPQPRPPNARHRDAAVGWLETGARPVPGWWRGIVRRVRWQRSG